MTYQVIARKYRPQTFDDLVGQEAIATTLKNAIKLKRVHHAFLFAGPRGVGKTSMARILAKALNCEKGPIAQPCHKCAACVEITESRSLDVIEIDGASTRGIDDIRQIRESVKFAPVRGKSKIYIIDEVHQVTTDGFNALLKTLEEPPPHAKFIFATTAAEKVPATILSRCQRFDFRRISEKVIADTLKAIAKKEKIKAEESALDEIARAGDGSLRDAESMLDQLSSFRDGSLTVKDVQEVLGAVDQKFLSRVFDAIAKRDAAALLGAAAEILDKGKDPAVFVEKCVEYLRDLMVIQASMEIPEHKSGSAETLAALKRQSEELTKNDLFYLFSVFSQGLQHMKRFKSRRVPLEMTLLKCASREPMVSLDAVSRAPSAAPSAPAASLKKNPLSNASAEAAPVVSAVDAEIPESPDLDAVWPNLIRRIRTEKISAATFLMEAQPVGIEGDSVVIGFPPSLGFHVEALSSDSNKRLLEKHLSELLGREARVLVKVIGPAGEVIPGGEGAPIPRVKAEEPPEVVKSALNLFGGRMLRNT